MSKYRVEFDYKHIKSIHPAHQPDAAGDTFLEQTTGEMMYAIVDAESDEEARIKAERLQTELQTGKTRREIERNENGSRNTP